MLEVVGRHIDRPSGEQPRAILLQPNPKFVGNLRECQSGISKEFPRFLQRAHWRARGSLAMFTNLIPATRFPMRLPPGLLGSSTGMGRQLQQFGQPTDRFWIMVAVQNELLAPAYCREFHTVLDSLPSG